MVRPINRLLVQHSVIFSGDCASKREKAKGLKRIKLAQIGIYPVVSGAILTCTGDGRLVQINGDTELVQLWCIGKSVSGADCLAAIAQYKKQIQIQSASAFSLSTNYIAAGSGHFMPLRINIRRNVPLVAHVEIIRPPLHHLHTGFQMFRLMHIRRPHAVALLVAHLALDGIL